MDKLTSPPISEQFELLSAYLDGEVSTSERKQVEQWLADDPEFKQTYRQMLALQEGWKSSPAVAPSMPTEQLVDRVMARLDRKPKLWVWGGIGAAAAIAVGAFSGLLSGNQGWVFRTAKVPELQREIALPPVPVPAQPPASTTIALRSNDLMLVLDRPPVDIPVVPGSAIKHGSDSDPVSSF
jgi:anti-sigma factor RsiW